jgi:hypothetical protein
VPGPPRRRREVEPPGAAITADEHIEDGRLPPQALDPAAESPPSGTRFCASASPAYL